ncbi:hypothetical protein Leryth_014315 [Lithospermum erythrorhizon]|nr:hypothetical protein Leryth_014315 [Lithospermum erythrorhizon]
MSPPPPKSICIKIIFLSSITIMASFLHFSPILLTLLPLLMLLSPAHSLTCTSQTFTNTPTKYTNCTDLPYLKAYLHWTFDPTNSTLLVAFIAPPAKPDGWIAWGINPTSTGMAGTHALIGMKDSKGSLIVKTYNVVSYRSLEETSKLSFKVLDSKAEDSNGTMKIFAKLELPVNMTTSLNQVWQVGSSVKNGVPEKHEFAPENLGSKGTLDFDKAAEGATGGGTTGGGNKNGTAAAQSGNETGGVSRGSGGVLGFLLSFGIIISLSF